MLHMCLRRMYILLLLKCSNISVRSIWPDFSLSPVFPFFFSFWLDDLLIVDNLVLKSSTIIVLSSDSPLRSVIVQLLARVQLFVTPWTAAHQASLSFINSQSLLKLVSIDSVMPSNHLILCRPLLLLPSIFPSIGVFSSVSVLHIRWPKYWSFSFSISPSNEYSRQISYRMDWLDLLAVQGTLKSLL